MSKSQEQKQIEKSPRADVLNIESGDGIHDQWALHPFAFEQGNGWLPTRLRCYHPDRKVNGELMEGYYDEFIPVAYEKDGGMVLKKKVSEETTFCPECDVPARRHDGDTMCPECGMLCHDSKETDNLLRTPSAAGRMTGEGS